MHSLQEMFKDSEDFEPMPYSGRAMYGKTCLAFRVSDLGKFISEVIFLLDEELYNKTEIAEAFLNMKTDNLGLDMVVYFPYVQYVNDVEEQE